MIEDTKKTLAAAHLRLAEHAASVGDTLPRPLTDSDDAPSTQLMNYCTRHNITLDWALLGEEPKYRAQEQSEREPELDSEKAQAEERAKELLDQVNERDFRLGNVAGIVAALKYVAWDIYGMSIDEPIGGQRREALWGLFRALERELEYQEGGAA